jgi:hypothetical protein
MWQRVPKMAWFGFGLIVIGAAIFGGWRWWMETRTWVPLEMSIFSGKGTHPLARVQDQCGWWL